MKIVIFDLKNTLIQEDKTWVDGAKEAFELAVRYADQTVIYSMNEPWTYTVLAVWSEWFRQSSNVLLVSKKTQEDLMVYKQPDVDVMVVGDSVTEELASAELLGFASLKVDGSLKIDTITAFLDGGEPR